MFLQGRHRHKQTHLAPVSCSLSPARWAARWQNACFHLDMSSWNSDQQLQPCTRVSQNLMYTGNTQEPASQCILTRWIICMYFDPDSIFDWSCEATMILRLHWVKSTTRTPQVPDVTSTSVLTVLLSPPDLSNGEQGSMENQGATLGSDLSRRDMNNMLTTVCCQVGCRKSDLTYLCWSQGVGVTPPLPPPTDPPLPELSSQILCHLAQARSVCSLHLRHIVLNCFCEIRTLALGESRRALRLWILVLVWIAYID